MLYALAELVLHISTLINSLSGGSEQPAVQSYLRQSQRNSSLDHREAGSTDNQLVGTINKLKDDPAKILYFKSKEKVLNQSHGIFLK